MNRRSFLGSLILLPLVAARALRSKPPVMVPGPAVSVPWDLAKGHDFSRMWLVSNPTGGSTPGWDDYRISWDKPQVCDSMISLTQTPPAEVERVMMTWTKTRNPIFQGRTVELRQTPSGELILSTSGEVALSIES